MHTSASKNKTQVTQERERKKYQYYKNAEKRKMKDK